MARLRTVAVDQPGWVWRGALGVVAFILLLPIILVVMAALVAGAVVFGVLAGLAILMQRMRRVFGGDGRENVRVVVRRE